MTRDPNPPPSPMDTDFWEFHRKNPEVLERLVGLARQAKARGRTRIGMKMLFEVVRWNQILRTKGDAYKLNNSYTSRYARLIEERHPELNNIFEKRRIRS